MKFQTLFTFFGLLGALTLIFFAAGCAGEPGMEQPTAVLSTTTPPPAAAETAVPTQPPPTPTTLPFEATETAADEAADLPLDAPASSLTPELLEATAEPFYFRDVTACGVEMPLLSDYEGPVVSSLTPDPAALQQVLDLIPEEALPALEQLLDDPQTVGLAAYRVGDEANGVFLNENVPLPLASVVKIVHLVAYAEAVAAGELNPTETILVEDLDRFYLPTLDLRAHEQALEALEENGRLFGDPPAMILDEVVGMMIEFSSNAATDYLHMRLGQERIEQTAQVLGLQNQTAPCPFAGQFLAMANHTRPQVSGQEALDAYLADPPLYGQEVMQLTAAFSEDPTFHDEAIAWRTETKLPSGQTQRLFSEAFNAKGTALEYAALMAKLALNGLHTPESSYLARQQLEWPMRFEANQEFFTNLAYKGGSLPGILTTVYYAYPNTGEGPLAVALFYHDLPGNTTYRQWRRTLAHDEFARWLLNEPEAIPLLRNLLENAN
jgi:D-alanyl-D-alanine carboxypeptidase